LSQLFFCIPLTTHHPRGPLSTKVMSLPKSRIA
jgi:hypothetical protein